VYNKEITDLDIIRLIRTQENTCVSIFAYRSVEKIAFTATLKWFIESKQIGMYLGVTNIPVFGW
jgi:hypothetical protein